MWSFKNNEPARCNHGVTSYLYKKTVKWLLETKYISKTYYYLPST